MFAQRGVLITSLLSTAMITGCLVDDGVDPTALDDGDELIAKEADEADGSGVLKDGSDPFTRVTVYSEAGQWGDQFAAGSGGGGWPNMMLEMTIDKDDLPANMINRISSARVVCGTRAGEVFFYKTPPNVIAFDYDWYSVGCSPGQTVDVNFHSPSVKTILNHESLADKVTGFYILTHTPTPFTLQNFSDQLVNGWNDTIESKLGSKADATGSAIIKYRGSNAFSIRQSLHIHTPSGCFDADGWMEYTAVFYQNHPGRPFWGVSSDSDAWGAGAWCNGSVRDALALQVYNGRLDFEAQLDAATNLGNYASYYLAPWWSNTFSLNFGPL